MCKTKELFYKLYSLRNCGRPYPAEPPVFGLKKAAAMDTTLQSGNYRLTEWQAALLLGGLSRLDKQVKDRDANAIYLNSLLAQIPGIKVMRRRPQVTQQSYFNFAFRIDADALGVDNTQFCQALNVELCAPDEFEPPYEPLNGCGLYKPLTKTRHNLSAAYKKAINPKRFSLPVCEDANKRTGVCAHHQILMNSKADMEIFAAAVKKIVDNAGELRGVTPGEMKKYQGPRPVVPAPAKHHGPASRKRGRAVSLMALQHCGSWRFMLA